MKWFDFVKFGLVLFVSITGFAQQSFWFKADPQVFNSNAWTQLTSQYALTKPEKALSASKNIELQKVYEVKGTCTLGEFKAACARFGTAVYSIERGPEYQPLFNPNDFGNQPGVSDYALSLINAPQAWDLTHGDDSVVIAISDQNYDITHPDLDGKVIHYDQSNTATPTHGTAVAITAAGNTDNGYGLASIGFNTSLALYKMNFNEILTASYDGADIINISWSSGCSFSQMEQDVMDEVAANGSFIVASAGNGNTCGLPDAYVYPASYNHVFSVTSVGPSDNHEQWVGDPTSTHNHNDSVDLAAPGYDVAVSPNDGWFLNMSGSSFAAAYVTGTAALMLASNKCISNLQIEQLLKNTAAPIDSINPAYAGLLGAGRLDAYQAVLSAAGTWNPIVPSFLVTDGCGTQDASATLIVQGGQGPYEVMWGNNVSGITNANLNTNIYTVHIEGSHGCRLDTAVFVMDVVPPTYNSMQVNPTCSDAENGGIQLNFTNNTLYNVQWSEGTTGAELSGVGAGNYTAFITYGDGCQLMQTFSLIAPAALGLNASVLNETAPGNGAITIDVYGGTAPYTYVWSNNETTESITDLTEGTYQISITDANGCQLADTFAIVNQISAGATTNEEIQVLLFPNPNHGVFQITLPSNEDFETVIYDLQGRLVFQDYLSGTHALQLKLSAGNYQAVFVSLASAKRTVISFMVN
jgi:hypothetical protein